MPVGIYIRTKKNKHALRKAWIRRKEKGLGIAWNKGKHSGNHGNGFQKGHIPWNKGKEYLQIKGKNHFRWKGGITPERVRERINLKAKKWRKKVFERDDYTCQGCDERNHKGRGKTVFLEVHHLISFAEHPEYRYEEWNGQTVCRPCHLDLHRELGFG